jgi:hypothetical protein
MMAVELPREEVALLFGTLTACGFLILGVLEIMRPAARRQRPTRPSRPPLPRLAPPARRAAPTSTPPATAALRLAAVVSRLEPLATQSAAVTAPLAITASQPATQPVPVAPQPVLVATQPVRSTTPPAADEQSVAAAAQPAALAPVPAAPRPAPAARSPRPLGAAKADRTSLPPIEIVRLLLELAAAEHDLERRVSILNRAVAGLTRSAEAAPEDEALSQMLTSTRALLWETWERIAMARLAAAMPWSDEILATEVTPVLARSR